MRLLPDHDRCPCCARRFRYVIGGDPDGRVHNSTMEVVVPEHGQEPLYRACPYCGARWHRYHAWHPRHNEAEPFVSEWPAYALRTVAQAWGEGVVQVATGDVGGGWVEARRVTETEPAASGTEHPSAATLHILTAWNPGGRPRSLQENQGLCEELREAIRTAGRSSRPAAVRDDEWRWAECSVAVLGAPDGECWSWPAPSASRRSSAGRLVS